MDNWDIREFYLHEYEHGGGPNNLPEEEREKSSSPHGGNVATRTFTLETNEHCRHRCTLALLGGVGLSLLLEIGVLSESFEAVAGGTAGRGVISSGIDFG